jgi:MFS transporter, Spinster family, sphingosine-1-phosphate transporter
MRLWERLEKYVGQLNGTPLLVIFTFINILNYIDRGIVPGAFESIGGFIRTDLNVSDNGVQMGLLQSMYIVGYAVASLVFGYQTRFRPPFQLMAIGLFIWCISVILSGFAPHYWVLVLARMLSGAGEASFQTVVPPWIDDNAPPSRRGLWLSIFFTAIPLGTAIGFAWGGEIATILTWRWAFFLEAIPMIPLVPIVFLVKYSTPASRKHADQQRQLTGELTPSEEEDGLVLPLMSPTKKIAQSSSSSSTSSSSSSQQVSSNNTNEDTIQSTSFTQEIYYVLTQPIYLAVVFGYAGYTAVLAGIGNFGPTIVEGLGIVHTQSEASLYFGIAVSLAGAIGTPLGGFLLDYLTKRLHKHASLNDGSTGDGTRQGDDTKERPEFEENEDMTDELESTDPRILDTKLNVALVQAVIFTLFGFVGCTAGILLGEKSSLAFFVLLSVGALCLCSTTAGINMAIMASIRPESRSFGIGLGTLLTHAFGDVPAPPIIGGIADKLSPQTCSSDGTNCTRSQYGLQVTLVVTLLWLSWPVLLWSLAWFMRRFLTKKKNNSR